MTHTHNTETKDDDLYSDLKLSFHTAYNENDGEGNLKSHKQTKLSITCSDEVTYFILYPQVQGKSSNTNSIQ